ncbi:MAG: hypothetical protein RJA22_1258 [Verrucomicrobiota bacterium]
MATLNSILWARCRLRLAVVLVAVGCGLGRAAEPGVPPGGDPVRIRSLPPRPERLYHEAKARWSRASTNATDCWHFGRACFDWAEHASNNTQRAALATEGIEACRQSIALAPSNAPAYFFLGLNCGQLARTKLLGALRLVSQMEGAWLKAVELDPLFDHGGPHRALGVLYRDAPGWPASIGSRSKARQHLLKAVELAPQYPGNRLFLLESYAQWGERRLIQQQAAETERFLVAARREFAGEEWALDWAEWDRLWARIKAQGQLPGAGGNARSPRDR